MNIKYLGYVSLLVALIGCETTNSVPYKASIDNVVSIQEVLSVSGKKVKLGEFTISSEADKDLMCRLMGPVRATPGKTIQEYIRDAFQEELFLAQAYATDASTTITGHLDKLKFSSISPAYWNITMTVSNQNGMSFQVSTKFAFSTSYSAYSACQNVSDAFAPTVQRLISEIITNPEFKRLISA